MPNAVSATVFAGLSLDRPRIMGVVNVTPDSFSDGGEAFEASAAVDRGLALVADGADIVDVGGESTRPGAQPIDPAEERARVVPVVRRLADEGVLVSVDTRHPEVMEAAVDGGAAIINDITALTGDPRSLDVVVRRGVSTILMHMRGDPRTMQIAPRYNDAAREVRDWLSARVTACKAAGVPCERVAVDPGIGFGKTTEHNLEIMARLNLYRHLGCALVIGVSRKSFVARLSRNEPPKQRVAGSLAAAIAAVEQGVHILRVHDVAETHQALTVWRAIRAVAPHRCSGMFSPSF